MTYGLEFAPALIAILAAALAVWLVLRLIRRVLQFLSRKPEHAVVQPRHPVPQERREPVLAPPAAPPASAPQIPDAADILALKASIDALTRQISSLEKKLVAPAQDNAPIAPAVRSEEASRTSAKPPLAS
jgi:hypothetical protein